MLLQEAKVYDPYAAPPRVVNRTSGWLGLLVIAGVLALLGASEYHVIYHALNDHVRRAVLCCAALRRGCCTASCACARHKRMAGLQQA